MINTPRQGDLRVYHFPQIPGVAFYVPVQDVDDAVKIMSTLAIYDQFQFQHRIKPDYSNAAGLEVFEDGEWCEWYGEAGEDIREYAEETEDNSSSVLIDVNLY